LLKSNNVTVWCQFYATFGKAVSKRAILGQLADVDIRLLHIFRKVAEAGGISAAELELNIGRSTVSRHIKDLETRLGVTLCRRGRGGFALTDEGAEIYAATLRLFAALDGFRAEVDEVHERMTGKIVLAIFDKTVTNPGCRIHDAIRRFDTIAPQVRIEIYVEPINSIERGIMDGTYHIGVIPEHRPSSSLDYTRLFEEKMHLHCGSTHVLFARDDTQLTRADVLSYKYAGLGYHSPNMEQGRELGITRDATAYDQEGIITLLLSGRYLGYLPDHYARSFAEQGLVRPLCTELFHYVCQYSAVVRHAPRPSRVIQTFLDELARSHAP
jgi:DNA-binding transcriptional LysR family regulator